MIESHQRLRLTFSVEGSLKWLGHLDLCRVWERALRRAGLPLLYSQGFSPHLRMAMAFPLAVGITSEAELLDLWLSHPLDSLEVARRVSSQLPAGLTLRGVAEVDLHSPSLQSLLLAAEYVVQLMNAPQDLAQRIQALLAARHCPRERRGRAYDLRPLIQSLSVEGGNSLAMWLQAGSQGTGRPDEVLLALGLDPQIAAIHRRSIALAPYAASG